MAGQAQDEVRTDENGETRVTWRPARCARSGAWPRGPV
jgi:hypothetical protein